MNESAADHKGLTTTQWLICIIASIGFAFDIYELLMLPLIVKPAIAALSGPLVQALVSGGMDPAQAQALYTPGGREYVEWARALFFVPAVAGGVFGLLGGWLTDRLGRRRVLTFSILLYAISACAAGFATSLPQLLFWRCLVFVGVCVEFVAAVAWLAELFPDPLRREKVLGYTQAFSSLGGILVAVANKICIALVDDLPAIHGVHEAWRYTLISGLLPAIPLVLIRPFLPESPVWQRKREAGQLRRPSIRELFQPALRRTTVLTTLVFAASYGIAFGAIQQMPQILPGHVDVQAVEKAAVDAAKERAAAADEPAPTPRALAGIAANARQDKVATVQTIQEIGGMLGRVLLAILAIRILSRRALLRTFQLPALILVPLMFWMLAQNLDTEGSLTAFKVGIFLCGVVTVSQFSFWGNYIPLVFPVHLRGTGESFAANIGGRVIGTAAAWLTLTLADSTPPDPARIALAAAGVAGAYALMGAILTQWLPEPKPGGVADD
ncbi:MAG: MFS transporter [Limisphaerales bacterium]